MKISKLKDAIYELVNVAEYEFTPTYFKNIDNACVEICEKLDKLADYEDKQEQGALVELKAKVGDDIFKIINGTISRLKITRIEITIYGIEYFVWGYTLTNEGCGVTWFLTEAEAEEALAKMGGTHE